MYRIYKKTEDGFIIYDDVTKEEFAIETDLPFMEGDLIDFDSESGLGYKMVSMFEALIAQKILRRAEKGSPQYLKAKETIDNVRNNPKWMRGDMLLKFLANRKALFDAN